MDRGLQQAPQLRIGRRKLQRHVGTDQFIPEFVVPVGHRRAGHRVGHGAVGTNDQQRVRLAEFRLALGPTPVFADRPQRGVQRIAGSERTGKILRSQHDAFRLNRDPALPAFDVDRATASSIGTIVGNDRKRAFSPGKLLARVGQPLAFCLQFRLQPKQLAARGLPVFDAVVSAHLQCRQFGLQLLPAQFQAADVVL